MIQRLLWCILTLLCVCPANSQQAKMSSFIRQIATLGNHGSVSSGIRGSESKRTLNPEVCAFVRIADGESERVFRENGCRSLAHWGDIHIAMIPVPALVQLASESSVSRIEARRPCHLLMDTTAICVNAQPIYEGRQLPQAYTGRGVVMGVMDIGFDLTHPNFFSADLSDYRIRCFWDQLAIGESSLPVGAEYIGRENILNCAHSRDGLDQTHGTHTLGIAAGSGYDSPYRGMAYESDICLVANAVTEDIALIDSADLYKYTSATDALGFKYIFDYAESVGQPCVISFSEGGPQGFSDEDRLFYEVLDSLTGPGRIIVASAGNTGGEACYVPKPRGTYSAGTYLFNTDKSVAFAASGDRPFDLRLVAYHEQPETLYVDSSLLFDENGQPLPDTLRMATSGGVELIALAYRSFYDPGKWAMELAVTVQTNWVGFKPEISIEAVGEEADVEMFIQDGHFLSGENYGVLLGDAEVSHSINSPSAAPSVISVGASAYRTGFVNYSGNWYTFNQGTEGERAAYSSVGPTFDGRIKPDVMAPGTNVVSSYSSFYYENHPNARDIVSSTIRMFDHGGRTYLWTSDAGTSMSAPVVGGTVALWLQAKPDLTPQQVMEVISKTARQDTDTIDYPNNLSGYGEIDAYAGLLAVLQLDVVDGISLYQPAAASVTLTPDRQLLIKHQPSPITVRIYDLAGRQVWSSSSLIPQDSTLITLPPELSGVYAVQLDGSPEIKGSTLVRL